MSRCVIELSRRAKARQPCLWACRRWGSAGRPALTRWVLSAHHACRPGRLFVRMLPGTCSLSGLVCYKAFCCQALLKPALQSVNPTM